MSAESLRQKHADRTRQAIVEAAIALFRERGFNGTTVDDIAQRADVAPRTFFRYFPTKESVLLEGAEAKASTIRTRIAERPEGESAVECLIAVLREITEEAAADCDWVELMCALTVENPRFLVDHGKAMHDEFASACVDGLAERYSISPEDLRLRAMTATLTACIETAVHAWLDDGAPDGLTGYIDTALDACRDAFETAARV